MALCDHTKEAWVDVEAKENKDERRKGASAALTIHALKRFIRRGRLKMASQLASPASTITSRTSDFRQVGEQRAHFDIEAGPSLLLDEERERERERDSSSFHLWQTFSSKASLAGNSLSSHDSLPKSPFSSSLTNEVSALEIS